LGTDADFDGPAWGLGFGPGFFFGTDAAIFVVCFLKPATSRTLLDHLRTRKRSTKTSGTSVTRSADERAPGDRF
jgi:hypothetical protein